MFFKNQEVKCYQNKQTSYEFESHYTSVMVANKPDMRLVEQKKLNEFPFHFPIVFLILILLLCCLRQRRQRGICTRKGVKYKIENNYKKERRSKMSLLSHKFTPSLTLHFMVINIFFYIHIKSTANPVKFVMFYLTTSGADILRI